MTIDSTTLSAALGRIAARTADASAELCAADGALGDGDLGITVSKGFSEAAAATLPEDFGMALLEVAKAFQRVSASSYGTLVATAFMAAAKATKGKSSIDAAELPGLVLLARDAMMARGKGSLGDKTVLDSIDAIDLVLRLKEITGKKINAEEFKHVRSVNDVVNAVYQLVNADVAAPSPAAA